MGSERQGKGRVIVGVCVWAGTGGTDSLESARHWYGPLVSVGAGKPGSMDSLETDVLRQGYCYTGLLYQ
jgi:hypothetical protein